MTKIMVVDDHTIFRQGIVSLLGHVEGVEVLAETGSGRDAVRLAWELRPDVILLDISLPDIDGIETARRIRNLGIDAGIVLLTMHKEKGLLDIAREVGVSSYILKDDAFQDLVYAIKAVVRGDSFVSSSLLAGSPFKQGLPSTLSPLTRREKEIVYMIAQGLSSKEVAERLFISVKTVETHRARIMRKLELRNTADLVRYAVRTGLVQA